MARDLLTGTEASLILSQLEFVGESLKELQSYKLIPVWDLHRHSKQGEISFQDYLITIITYKLRHSRQVEGDRLEVARGNVDPRMAHSMRDHHPKMCPNLADAFERGEKTSHMATAMRGLRHFTGESIETKALLEAINSQILGIDCGVVTNTDAVYLSDVAICYQGSKSRVRI